jgi:metal-responsive CopG/Arc/MetJ family transcriptional regulator
MPNEGNSGSKGGLIMPIVQVELDMNLHTKLNKYCVATRLSMRDVIREAIKEYLARKEQEAKEKQR